MPMKSTFLLCPERKGKDGLAEGVGFEPTRALASPGAFQDRCLKPLGHPSELGAADYAGGTLKPTCRSVSLLLSLRFDLGKSSYDARRSAHHARGSRHRVRGDFRGVCDSDARLLRTGCASQRMGALRSRSAAQLPGRLAPQSPGALRAPALLIAPDPVIGTGGAAIELSDRDDERSEEHTFELQSHS